ncbi:methylated-DNA--[protein]-cysteine S-methyltransferase [Acidisphaera sp. S103]|uniref:methylated-DNA--[protein]-cysteine S-methyltransferase n=1 Tax=Acidisphaera sp. S103 TaxID=1747223 RepID=UPI00131D58F8|nr:methylated-DNA--[protein]-cysteine S-methyltransferase [Acidisphaera sp. S103]
MSYAYKWIASPVGNLKLVASDAGLAATLWENDQRYKKQFESAIELPENPTLKEAERQLGEYFRGERTTFDIPLDFAGTDFQKKVWRALLTIPFGQTRTYSEIARQVGHPKAVRAVGSAANRNPLAVLAPCHRVVGASGELTGFAGGLQAKICLLILEIGENGVVDGIDHRSQAVTAKTLAPVQSSGLGSANQQTA